MEEGHISRDTVLLKVRKDREKEQAKNTDIYISRSQGKSYRKHGKRSKLPQKIYVESEWCNCGGLKSGSCSLFTTVNKTLGDYTGGKVAPLSCTTPFVYFAPFIYFLVI